MWSNGNQGTKMVGTSSANSCICDSNKQKPIIASVSIKYNENGFSIIVSTHAMIMVWNWKQITW